MADDNAKKKMAELDLWNNGNKVTYNGRLLGLITDKEYAALVEKPELRSKITNVATAKISDIGGLDEVRDLRLAMTVKKKDGFDIINRTLFITERLCYISQVDYIEQSMAFMGCDGTFIAVKGV